jgi:hypothetical protein
MSSGFGLHLGAISATSAVQALKLGKLTLVNIGFASKPSGSRSLRPLLGSAWFLSHVEITHLLSGTVFTFCHNNWLRLNISSGRVDLRPGSASSSVPYKITVATSDIRGAGTDATIRVTLFGRKADGSTVQFPSCGHEGTCAHCPGLHAILRFSAHGRLVAVSIRTRRRIYHLVSQLCVTVGCWPFNKRVKE